MPADARTGPQPGLAPSDHQSTKQTHPPEIGLATESQDDQSRSSARFFGEQSSAGLTSLALHAAILIILGLFVLPLPDQGRSLINLAASAISSSGPELIDFEVASPSEDAVEEDVEPAATVNLDWESDFDAIQESLVPPLSLDDLTPEQEAMDDFDVSPDGMNEIGEKRDVASAAKKSRKKRERPTSAVAWIPTISKKGVSVQEPLLVSAKDGVKQVASTEAAAAGVLGSVKTSLDQDGQVWVLWVMDASLSLLQERQMLGEQVFSFYQGIKLGEASRTRPKPKTKVFAFGQQVVPVATDMGTSNPTALARSIMALPIDQTGVENVLTAVAAAINTVPTRKPLPRIEVIVWTDESGDDLALLEDLIFLCRGRNARVHVVGPLSVFGMERGMQLFKLPAPFSTSVFLPVRRGPDSVFPERAQLPFWYEAGDIDWGNSKIIPASDSLQNFGGPHRERLLAPSGPYGLTRLALATGGSFTALNRVGDIAAATRTQLFDYMPDYRSGLEIAYEIDEHPLRKAIIEAAALTGAMQYWPPPQQFPLGNRPNFPFTTVATYVPPESFPSRLSENIGMQVRRLRPTQAMIEQAIQIMTLRFQANEYDAYEENDKDDLKLVELDLDAMTPKAYEQEESPRWRAWYDLNLGRLLAHSVRIAEYVKHAEHLTSRPVREQMLGRGINMISFYPSPNVHAGSVSQMRMELSVKLLNRVIKDHPDTPWSDLAGWELQNAYGLDTRYDVIPPPPPPPPGIQRTSTGPVPSLPNL